MRLRDRIVSTVAVNLAWTMVWIEVRSGIGASLLRSLVPWV